MTYPEKMPMYMTLEELEHKLGQPKVLLAFEYFALYNALPETWSQPREQVIFGPSAPMFHGKDIKSVTSKYAKKNCSSTNFPDMCKFLGKNVWWHWDHQNVFFFFCTIWQKRYDLEYCSRKLFTAFIPPESFLRWAKLLTPIIVSTRLWII